jgi:hypothetical protein
VIAAVFIATKATILAISKSDHTAAHLDIPTMTARIQVPKLKVSPTGASTVTAWRKNLIHVCSSGVAAHLDGAVRPTSQEQADLVLCLAKDETSVEIMRRRFSCNFLCKSRF